MKTIFIGLLACCLFRQALGQTPSVRIPTLKFTFLLALKTAIRINLNLKVTTRLLVCSLLLFTVASIAQTNVELSVRGERYFCVDEFVNGYLKTGPTSLGFGEGNVAGGGSYDMLKVGCNGIYQWDETKPIIYKTSGNGILQVQNSSSGLAMLVDPKVSMSAGTQQLNYEISLEWNLRSTCPYDPPIITYNYHGTATVAIFKPQPPTLSYTLSTYPQIQFKATSSYSDDAVVWAQADCPADLSYLLATGRYSLSGKDFPVTQSKAQNYQAKDFVVHPLYGAKGCWSDPSSVMCVVPQYLPTKTPPCAAATGIVDDYDPLDGEFFDVYNETPVCVPCNVAFETCSKQDVYALLAESPEFNTPMPDDFDIPESKNLTKRFQDLLGKKYADLGKFAVKQGSALASKALGNKINNPQFIPTGDCSIVRVPAMSGILATQSISLLLGKQFGKFFDDPADVLGIININKDLVKEISSSTFSKAMATNEMVMFRDPTARSVTMYSTPNSPVHPLKIKRSVIETCDGGLRVRTEVQGYVRSDSKIIREALKAMNLAFYSTMYKRIDLRLGTKLFRL